MKFNAIGIQRIKGISAKGNEFDMCNLLTLQPVEPVNNAKVNISGHGFRVVEMQCDPAALNEFAGLKFPCPVEVTVEPRARSGRFESVIVGAKAA